MRIERNVAERITAYAILGGAPTDLIQFSEKLSIRQSIERQILKPTFLHGEVRFILMENSGTPKHRQGGTGMKKSMLLP